MARIEPFKKWRIATEISDRLESLKKQEHFRGSMTAFIESILDKYSVGVLTEAKLPDVKQVHAVRVRRVSSSEQRKTA